VVLEEGPIRPELHRASVPCAENGHHQGAMWA
jgi:hypothetical protein